MTAQTIEMGEPFRVNEDPASQWDGTLGVAAVGESTFVVTWNRAGSEPDPLARRVDGAGPQGDEFPLAFLPTDVAGMNDALWVVGVLWGQWGEQRVVAQHLTSDGMEMGPSFFVSSEGDAYPSARVALAPDGTFMVVWFVYFDEPLPESGPAVPEACGALGSYGRGFGADGLPAGAPFRVPSSEGRTRATMTEPGRWVISGFDNCYDEGGAAGERRALDGGPIGSAFPLDEVEELAALSGGGFAGVWTSQYEVPSEVRTRRYASDGAPQGEVTVARSCSTCLVSTPRSVGGESNDALVLWLERSPGTTDNSLYARWFGAEGEVSEAVVVNGDEPPRQDHVEVVSDGHGLFMVVWTTPDGLGDYDIWARVLRSPALFSDGFESGDTAAWSRTVP